MSTEKSTKKIDLTEAHCRVAWFECGKNNGKFKGFKLGVVIVTNELSSWARIGVASEPMGGYSDEVDAAYIFYEGDEIDMEAAERIMLMHEGVQVYID